MEQIRQLRQERNLSQAQLAVMAGMDPATLNRLEQGKGNPTIRTLQQVADVLGVSAADLLEESYPKAQAPLPPNALTVGVGGADDPIRAATVIGELWDLTTGFAAAWNRDIELYEEHGLSIQPYRTLEMSAALIVLRQLFFNALGVLQRHAAQQGFSPNPGAWDPQTKRQLIEALAGIRTLEELHKVIDRSSATPGANSENFRAMREEFDVGTSEILADDPLLTEDPQWTEAMEKARTVAGLT